MYPLFHPELRDNSRKAKGRLLFDALSADVPRHGASSMNRKFYEFFAGGGMARAGLGREWTCLFANDFDHKKGRLIRRTGAAASCKTADIRKLKAKDLPGVADLSWASFPCQDLSLAGAGAGLRGERSGTFWPFWKLMKGLIAENRAPQLLNLEGERWINLVSWEIEVTAEILLRQPGWLALLKRSPTRGQRCSRYSARTQ